MPPSDSMASCTQRAGLRGLKRQLVIRALHAGQGEQVLGDAVHAGGVFENDAEKLAGGFSVGRRLLDQRLDVALDGGERSAQFMADVGDELAAEFSAASMRVTSWRTASAPPEGMGAALISKMRPGASELARPDCISRSSSAALTQASNSGSRTEMNQRPAGANLRAGDALHLARWTSEPALRG